MIRELFVNLLVALLAMIVSIWGMISIGIIIQFIIDTDDSPLSILSMDLVIGTIMITLYTYIPFALFFCVTDYITRHLAKKSKWAHGLMFRLVVSILGMVIVVLVMILFDTEFDISRIQKLPLEYFSTNYAFFVVFVPISAFLKHIASSIPRLNVR